MSSDQGTDTPPDVRLAPIAAAAWAAMWVATSGSWWLTVSTGLLTATLAAAGWWRRNWVLITVAMVLAVGLTSGGLRYADRHSGVVPELATASATSTVRLEIAADPRPGRGDYSYVRATVREVEGDPGHLVRSPIVLIVTGDEFRDLLRHPVGTQLRASVRWAPAEPGDDVAAVARTRSIETVAEPGFTLRQVERVRGGLREAVATSPPGQRALVPALVLGDISAMTDELRDTFVRTGLTHLTAVSGANLTYLLVFLTLAARALGVRGRWLQVVGIVGVAIFVALCRTEPSVLRAAAMGLVTVAALSVVGTPLRGAPRRGVRHLALAVLVLVLIDPWLSRSIGFVLSVTASGGIILWASVWTNTLAGWLPKPIAEAIAVPLAAQLATQPVVTAISGEVSLVGLVANALAGPAVGPATVLGFAAAGASLIHPLPAALLGWAAGWCAQVVIWVADYGGALPGAAVTFPTTAWAVAWLVAVVALMAPITGWVLRHPLVVAAVAGLLVIAVLRGPTPPGWPPKEWTMVACDVGQGDAFVLRAAPRQAVVIDTGPDPLLLRRCLSELDIQRVPLLVLSHYHADHIGGLAGLDMPVDAVLVSPLASPPEAAAEVEQQFPNLVHPVRPGQEFQIGDVHWRVLGPERVPTVAQQSDGESSVENDASISAVAEVNGIRILFTGDLTELGQRHLAPRTPPVDVFKVAHHGSGDFDPGLLEATHAQIAVIGVGADNTYGHPAPSLLRALNESGFRVIARTDQHGAVALLRTDDHLRVISRNPTHPSKGTS